MTTDNRPALAAEPGLKDVMRRVAATVCVISFADQDGADGITVSSFTSVTLNPPTVLFCVNHAASVYPRLKHASRYCVNILHAEQAALSQFFAVGKPEDLAVQWAAVDGVPTLADAQCHIVCDALPPTTMGTHDVFFGRVRSVTIREDVAPLTYLNGRYAQIK